LQITVIKVGSHLKKHVCNLYSSVKHCSDGIKYNPSILKLASKIFVNIQKEKSIKRNIESEHHWWIGRSPCIEL